MSKLWDYDDSADDDNDDDEDDEDDNDDECDHITNCWPDCHTVSSTPVEVVVPWKVESRLGMIMMIMKGKIL